MWVARSTSTSRPTPPSPYVSAPPPSPAPARAPRRVGPRLGTSLVYRTVRRGATGSGGGRVWDGYLRLHPGRHQDPVMRRTRVGHAGLACHLPRTSTARHPPTASLARAWRRTSRGAIQGPTHASSARCTQVKRLGGGFGGKESRTVPFSVAIAVAAHKLGRPVRINVERDKDMLMTGQRHAFRGECVSAVARAARWRHMRLTVQPASRVVVGGWRQVQGRVHVGGCVHRPQVPAVQQRRLLARSL